MSSSIRTELHFSGRGNAAADERRRIVSLDIVWRQFKKNRLAYYSLWFVIALLFLLANFSPPVIASNVPLVFKDGEKTIYPWWNSLFHPDIVVDLAFNMALVGLVPWCLLALLTHWLGKRLGISGRGCLGIALCELILIVAGLSIAVGVFDLARPTNPYSTGAIFLRSSLKIRTSRLRPMVYILCSHSAPPSSTTTCESNLPVRFRKIRAPSSTSTVVTG